MYKVIKLSKEVTELIENSVFKDCSLNAVFRIVLNGFNTYSNVFLERLSMGYSPAPRQYVSVKIDSDLVERFDKVVSYINRERRIVTRSFTMLKMLEHYLNPIKEVVLTINVKGYRCKDSDLIERLKAVAVQLNNLMPDIVFLQEVRIGEDKKILERLLNNLSARYFPVLPVSFNSELDYNACVCIALVRNDLMKKCKILRIGNEGREWKHRYNKLQISDRIYMNVWIQQTFGSSNENTRAIAEDMWQVVLSEAELYTNVDTAYYLLGDLNSCQDVFGRELGLLSEKLVNTKCNSDFNTPTCALNILDYAFANRYAIQKNKVITRIFQPSMRELMISDHEALVMTIS